MKKIDIQKFLTNNHPFNKKLKMINTKIYS